MADIKQEYIASSALTCTVASLATSSTLVAGRESTAVTLGASSKPLDCKISGRVTTGTSPTAGRIEVWAIPKMDDSTWPDVFDGTDSAETVTSRDLLYSYGKLIATMFTTSTSNVAYDFVCESLNEVLGCKDAPRDWVIFVTHSTVAALHATGGNHFFVIQPKYATVN